MAADTNTIARAVENGTNTLKHVILEATAEDPNQAAAVLNQLQEYGGLFSRGLYLIVIGVVLVFLLQRFGMRLILRRVKNRRLVLVGFGFLYAFIVLLTALLALDSLGIDTTRLSKISFLALILLTVLAYFLVPFLPRLPFTLGQVVIIDGEMGTIETVSHFHTMVRKFDGTLVFIPNPLVLSKKILNISYTPHRRVEIKLNVNTDCDLRQVMATCMRLMQEDERFVDEPSAPAVYIVGAAAAGVDVMIYGFVKNADWFRARSDLYLNLVDAFMSDDRISLSLPQSEIYLHRQQVGKEAATAANGQSDVSG